MYVYSPLVNFEYFITFYIRMYIILDANKAFDKINHWMMFSKLQLCSCIYLRYGASDIAINLCMQSVVNYMSFKLSATNGVRQGGTPLKCIYLSDLLNQSNSGGSMGSKHVIIKSHNVTRRLLYYYLK